MMTSDNKYHTYKDVLSMVSNYNSKTDELPILITYHGQKIDCCFVFGKDKKGLWRMYVDIYKLQQAIWCIDNQKIIK